MAGGDGPAFWFLSFARARGLPGCNSVRSHLSVSSAVPWAQGAGRAAESNLPKGGWAFLSLCLHRSPAK